MAVACPGKFICRGGVASSGAKSIGTVGLRLSRAFTSTMRLISFWLAGSSWTNLTPSPRGVWLARATSALPLSSTKPSLSETSKSSTVPTATGSAAAMNMPVRLTFIDWVSTKSMMLSYR